MVIRDAHIVIKLYKNLRNGSGKVRVAVYFGGTKGQDREGANGGAPGMSDLGRGYRVFA